MIRIILSLFLCTTVISVNAQIPQYGIWPSGVVFADINGNQHNIDAILDAGQSVIIDAFADWCAPCWSYHQTQTLENVHQALGAGGTDVVRVFSVEIDPAVPESSISDANSGMGDWTQGVTYPLINDDNLDSILNVTFYPVLILICPDRTVSEIGSAAQAQWTTAVANCTSIPSNTNDPRIVGYSSRGSYLCGGATTADADLTVAVQNYTSTALNGTYTIKVMDGANELTSTDVLLDIGSFEIQEVNLGPIALPAGTTNLTAEITTFNDDTSNDQIAVSITNIQATTVSSTAIEGLTLDVTFDDYASEFGMVFNSGIPYTDDLNAIYGDAENGITTPIVFSQTGALANGTVDYSWNLPTSTEGCYYLVMVDSSGNGMINPQEGNILVSSVNGTSHTISPYLNEGEIYVYDVVFAADLNEVIETGDIKVYPNPVVSEVTVDFNAKNSPAEVSLVNVLGQEVYSSHWEALNGSQSIKINTSELKSGLYQVSIVIDGHKLTERISIVSE